MAVKNLKDVLKMDQASQEPRTATRPITDGEPLSAKKPIIRMSPDMAWFAKGVASGVIITMGPDYIWQVAPFMATDLTHASAVAAMGSLFAGVTPTRHLYQRGRWGISAGLFAIGSAAYASQDVWNFTSLTALALVAAAVAKPTIQRLTRNHSQDNAEDKSYGATGKGNLSRYDRGINWVAGGTAVATAASWLLAGHVMTAWIASAGATCVSLGHIALTALAPLRNDLNVKDKIPLATGKQRQGGVSARSPITSPTAGPFNAARRVTTSNKRSSGSVPEYVPAPPKHPRLVN